MNRKGILFLIIILLSLSSQASAQGEKEAVQTLRVAASINPVAFLASEIGGEEAEVHTIVRPGESPASYEPAPRQVSRILSSDLLLRVGVPFENKLIPNIRSSAPKLPIVDLREGIDVIDGDPHIWMSPRNMKQMARVVFEAFVQADPDQKAYYLSRYEALVVQLSELDQELSEIFNPLQGESIFVYHPAYGYLARDYGLTQIPLEIEGKEPSPRQLASYIERARSQGVRVLFVQPEFSPKSAQTVAEAIGGSVVGISPLERDYIQGLRRAAEELRRGIQ